MTAVDQLNDIALRFTRGERLNIAPSGKRFFCNFIEPGIVSYEDCGGDVELLRKETIDAALGTAMGNPLTVRHVPTDLDQYELDRVSRGQIDRVGYNENTGWFFCEGTVDDDHARQLLRPNPMHPARPSCGYTVLEFGPGGVYHNIPYAREITKIKFHHLAIVDNPRYEGADIRLNSKEKPAMTNPFKWLRKKLVPATATTAEATVDETGEIHADATVEIDGKQVRFNDLADAHKRKLEADKIEADRLEKEKADREAAEARTNGMVKLNGDDEVEIDGKKVKMNALIDCFRVYGCRDNETAEEKEKRENAVRDQKEKDRLEAEKQTRENGRQHFVVLAGARTNEAAPVERANSANTEAEQMKRGQERYGGIHQSN